MMTEKSESFETIAQAKGSEIQSQTETKTATDRTWTGNSSIASLANNPDLQQLTTATAAKIDTLKKWTVNTYKNTKHLCMEHMGKVEKTTDKELDERIDNLRELRRCYKEIVSIAHHYINYLALANNMQRSMASAFCELALKETAIAKELNLNSELFGLMLQNNEPLHRKLTLFLSSIQTLTDSAIEDTFLTIESYNQVRLEYDVCRQELQSARENTNISAEMLAELYEQCNGKKRKYEQLKEDVRTKLVLLEENRCKVMRKQTLALQKALATAFSANSHAIEQSLADLANMGLTGEDSLPNAHSNSFLEK